MKNDKTTSSLLVPDHLLPKLKKKIEEHGNLMVYFKTLLATYRLLTHSGMLPIPRKVKTEYQDDGLKLQRISFRVYNEDWIELGALALAFGKSRCYLFTFLLELDLVGAAEPFINLNLSDLVTTKFNLVLNSSWLLNRFYSDYIRAYHVRA